MSNQRRISFILTGVFLSALIAIIVSVLELGRNDYAQNIAIKACMWVVYTSAEIKYGIELKNYIRVLVMTVIISDSFFGLYLDLYITSVVFDKLQHVFGGYAFSLFAYNLICQITQPVISKTFSMIFVISLGLSVGVIYEIAEFIGDLAFKPEFPSQPSLFDTNLDLISDVVGALIAAAHVKLLFRNYNGLQGR